MKHLFHELYILLHRRHYRLSRHLFHEFMVKKKGIETRASEIEVLGLGSSHCTRGFNAEMIENAFNLSYEDQDLYTAHCLFDKYISKMEKLKKVILFYSIHSPGYEVCKTKFNKYAVLSHYIFDIQYPDPEPTYLKDFKYSYHHRKRKFQDKNINYQQVSGYIPEKSSNIEYFTAEFRCAHHLRENARPIKQDGHLHAIINACQKRNIQCYIVIAPVRKDYIDQLQNLHKTDEDLFQDLFKWTKNHNIPVLNELRSPDYDWNDFADCDHLSNSGADKLTQKIIQMIK